MGSSSMTADRHDRKMCRTAIRLLWIGELDLSFGKRGRNPADGFTEALHGCPPGSGGQNSPRQFSSARRYRRSTDAGISFPGEIHHIINWIENSLYSACERSEPAIRRNPMPSA
jgi:hypothetical protein